MKSLARKVLEKLERVLNKSKSILETSLYRMNQHVQKGDPFAIISACRSKVSPKKNKENTEELKRLALQNGFGYTSSIGGYVEEQIDKTKKDVLEDSVIVFSNKEREKELLTFAMRMGIKYYQDSILFCDSKGNTYFKYTRDIEDPDYTWKKGEKKQFSHRIGDTEGSIGNYHPNRNKDDKYFTRIKGKDFTIK